MAEYQFDNRKLRGKIVEKYGTIGNFSEAIGVNRSKVSMKLNGKAAMNRGDIMLFCSALDVEGTEISDYFFNLKVAKL